MNEKPMSVKKSYPKKRAAAIRELSLLRKTHTEGVSIIDYLIRTKTLKAKYNL